MKNCDTPQQQNEQLNLLIEQLEVLDPKSKILNIIANNPGINIEIFIDPIKKEIDSIILFCSEYI